MDPAVRAVPSAVHRLLSPRGAGVWLDRGPVGSLFCGDLGDGGAVGGPLARGPRGRCPAEGFFLGTCRAIHLPELLIEEDRGPAQAGQHFMRC